MAQFNSGEVYTNVTPGKTVTSDRMNNMINGATLLNGAVLDQVEKTITVGADTVLLGDSTLAASGIPKKVQLTNLQPETVRNGSQQYIADTGAANAYVVALSPAAVNYIAGMVVRFKASNANTAASTINVNGLGAKSIVTRSGGALVANDILANMVCVLVYDGTSFYLINSLSALQVKGSQAAADLAYGICRYAAGAGTANVQTATLAPVPAAYTEGMEVRFKASVANTGAVTLNVNALGAITIKKVVAGAVADLAANDIQVADMVTVVYNGAAFVMTGRVRSWDYVATAAATLAAGVQTFAHGLGFVPNKISAVLVCTTPQGVFGVGAEVPFSAVAAQTSGTFQVGLWADATNINAILYSANLQTVTGTGAVTVFTAGSWKVKVYASI